jgi:hypothetical protein
MTPLQFSIHDNLTEAILHIEKAHDLICAQVSYSCQSVDVNAVEAACAMLVNLRDVLKDVDQSALEHTVSFPTPLMNKFSPSPCGRP